jgi:DNA-binding SARP family transcriptional activator
VRNLLALLVVHGTLSRDRIIDLLWPDRVPAEGARNLRVTLTHLRRLVEPARASGEATFHVRSDLANISLHRSEHLRVDLWEMDALAERAAAARSAGDLDQTIRLLDTAVDLWRGEPLADLRGVLDEESAIEAARLTYRRCLLLLGELRLARGHTADALIDADRALAIDPYDERAHRLAIAAATRTRDKARVARTCRRTLDMLAEVGADPEMPTRILLRQAADVSDARRSRRPSRSR